MDRRQGVCEEYGGREMEVRVRYDGAGVDGLTSGSSVASGFSGSPCGDGRLGCGGMLTKGVLSLRILALWWDLAAV